MVTPKEFIYSNSNINSIIIGSFITGINTQYKKGAKSIQGQNDPALLNQDKIHYFMPGRISNLNIRGSSLGVSLAMSTLINLCHQSKENLANALRACLKRHSLSLTLRTLNEKKQFQTLPLPIVFMKTF